MYPFVIYLYVSCCGSITSVGEERANLSTVVYLYLCGFFSERFPLPLRAWDGLRYFIVALPEPSIYVFCLFKGKGDALDRGDYKRLKLTYQVMKVKERIADSLIR